MAAANLGDLVTTTLRNRRGVIADNILAHNAVLRFLNRAGKVDPADGGRTLVEELEYAENQTFKYYSGYEVLDISPSDVFDSAEYEWKQAAVVVSVSGAEERKNAGREQSLRLVDRRIKNAEKTMMNNLSIGVYSDGTGASGKQIGGLQALVADDPTTGVVGGIDRSAFSFWRNQLYDFSAAGVTPGETTIQKAMNSLWLACLRGADAPRMIVADGTYFNYYWQSLQAIQRISSEEEAGAGFRSIQFYGPGGSAPVMYDDQCPAEHMYMLNTDYLFWRPHKLANMEPLEKRQSVNQDATVIPIIFMGNLTMSNAARQGVMHA